MITGIQIRAARALLKWSAKDLERESNVSWSTIQRMESVDGIPNVNTTNLIAIKETIERQGIVFVDKDSNGGIGVRFEE